MKVNSNTGIIERKLLTGLDCEFDSFTKDYFPGCCTRTSHTLFLLRSITDVNWTVMTSRQNLLTLYLNSNRKKTKGLVWNWRLGRLTWSSVKITNDTKLHELIDRHLIGSNMANTQTFSWLMLNTWFCISVHQENSCSYLNEQICHQFN